MLKEIEGKEAVLQAYMNNVRVIALYSDLSTNDITAELDRVFGMEDSCRFLIDEPEKEESVKDSIPPLTNQKRASRKNIDTGKMKALHDAGWSNVKIADEMGLSPITVGKYLKELKEE